MIPDWVQWLGFVLTVVAVVGFGYVSWWYYSLMKRSGYIDMLQEEAKAREAGKDPEDPFAGMTIGEPTPPKKKRRFGLFGLWENDDGR